MAKIDKPVKLATVGEPGQNALDLVERTKGVIERELIHRREMMARYDSGAADQVDDNACSTQRAPWSNYPPEVNSVPLGSGDCRSE